MVNNAKNWLLLCTANTVAYDIAALAKKIALESQPFKLAFFVLLSGQFNGNVLGGAVGIPEVD